MGKKDEKEVEKEGEKVVEKLEEKVEQKLEKAEEKIEKVTGEKQNIINYVPKPRVDDPDFDFKKWAENVDARLNKILEMHEKKSEAPKPDPEAQKKLEIIKKQSVKQPWYDVELF